ncbi:hypothetical protein EfmAA610_07500 [Enterococcus faecium]|nr:hypothetical protein EfmAA610_07500 [Enterococcus faecium]
MAKVYQLKKILSTAYVRFSDLFLQLEELTKKEHYDAIIHSMAVSDFTPAFSFVLSFISVFIAPFV